MGTFPENLLSQLQHVKLRGKEGRYFHEDEVKRVLWYVVKELDKKFENQSGKEPSITKEEALKGAKVEKRNKIDQSGIYIRYKAGDSIYRIAKDEGLSWATIKRYIEQQQQREAVKKSIFTEQKREESADVPREEPQPERGEVRQSNAFSISTDPRKIDWTK